MKSTTTTLRNCGFAWLLNLILSFGANAASPLPLSFDISLMVNGGNHNHVSSPTSFPQTYSTALDDNNAGVHNRASGSVANDPNPTATASASGFGASDVMLSYYFVVNGPTLTSVPVDMKAILSATVINRPPDYLKDSWYNYASISVSSGNFSSLLCISFYCPTGDSVTNTIFQTFYVKTGDEVLVQLNSTSVAGHSDNSLSSRSAATFQISSSFQNQNAGYTLAVSSGIDNVSAIPEPSTIQLLAVGLLVVVVAAFLGSAAISGRSEAA